MSPEIVTTRVLFPDSIEIGTPSKGGALHIHFDAGDLAEAQQRIDNAVQARAYLLTKLTQGGMNV
jgi:hypothetical protein